MKNKLLKLYLVALSFYSTSILFAQPGTQDTGGAGNLEGTSGDTTPAPIDDYIWVLILIGLVFVFMKYRAIQKNKIQG